MAKVVIETFGGDVRLRAGWGSNEFLPTDDTGVNEERACFKTTDDRTNYTIDMILNHTTNLDYDTDSGNYRVDLTAEKDPNDPTRFLRFDMKIFLRTLKHTCITCLKTLALADGSIQADDDESDPTDPLPQLWPTSSYPIHVEVGEGFNIIDFANILDIADDIAGHGKMKFDVWPTYSVAELKTPRIRFVAVAEACETSHIGYLPDQDSVISLGIDCRDVGTIRHEFGHALCRIHEFARHDRSSFVRILWRNIKDDWKSQFKKQNGYHGAIHGLEEITFDNRSRMLYDRYGDPSVLDENGDEKPTYERLDGRNDELGPWADGAYSDKDYEWFKRYGPGHEDNKAK